MTNKEHKLLSDKIEEARKEVSKDPKKAREMLMQTGFYTPTGKLKKACS
jgi:hypothetical protein